METRHEQDLPQYWVRYDEERVMEMDSSLRKRGVLSIASEQCPVKLGNASGHWSGSLGRDFDPSLINRIERKSLARPFD